MGSIPYWTKTVFYTVILLTNQLWNEFRWLGQHDRETQTKENHSHGHVREPTKLGQNGFSHIRPLNKNDSL